MFENMKKVLFVMSNNNTAATENITPEKNEFLDRLFEITNGNMQKVGNKTYAEIPVELLEIDDEYQRIVTYNKDRVSRLTTQFDINKMDTLVVSVHEEEKRYYIVDGMHRYLAAINRDIKSLPCEIKFFDGDPEARQKAEAEYFINQYLLTDPLSAMDQHKGRVLLGVPEYVVLNEAVTERKELHFKNNNYRGKQKDGTLTGYVEAVRISRKGGKELISNVLDIVIGAKWDLASTGLSNYSLRMISDVYSVHHTEAVKVEIAKVLRNINPKDFRSIAKAKYLMRSQSEANALYLEDLVCTNLGIKRLIDTDIPRYNPVTESMEPVA